MSNSSPRSARDNLYRGYFPGITLRVASTPNTDAMPTMVLRLTPFMQWAEIDSFWEGHFMERFDPGAFTKTIDEQGDAFRVLLQHGRDPVAGFKPLGPAEDLRSGDTHLMTDVPLFDTGYNREIVPALDADLFGASIRFRPLREEVDKEPARSATNPDGIEERTVKEAALYEGGPVMFPAYSDTGVDMRAGARSLTDFMLGTTLDTINMGEAIRTVGAVEAGRKIQLLRDRLQNAPSTSDAGHGQPKAAAPTSGPERRVSTRQPRPWWALPERDTHAQKERPWRLP